MTDTLPTGFEALQPFVKQWAVSGSVDHALARSNSCEAEREAFFVATKDMVGPALELLDRKPVEELDSTEKRLLDLLLSFAHVAMAVEVQGRDEERHAQYRQYMRITASPAGV